MFGPAALIVRCRNFAEMRGVVSALEGQLTAALHLDTADVEAARAFIPMLERKVGRILVNGFGTGVEAGCGSASNRNPTPNRIIALITLI